MIGISENGSTVRIWAPRALAALFSGSGVLHFAVPRVFAGAVPRWLPAPVALVYVSGAAELICAAGLLSGRRWAGPASAALLVAVLPANVQMALDLTRSSGILDWKAIAAWARVPMQAPLIWSALQSRR